VPRRGALRWKYPAFLSGIASISQNFDDSPAHRNESSPFCGLDVRHKDHSGLPIEILDTHPQEFSFIPHSCVAHQDNDVPEENIVPKMAGTKISGIVEDVPFVPATMRHIFSVYDFGTVPNPSTTLPTVRGFFVRGYKLAAINGADDDVFSENDVRAEFQQVEIVVRDQPFVEALRSNREHDVDRTLGEIGLACNCRNQGGAFLSPFCRMVSVIANLSSIMQCRIMIVAAVLRCYDLGPMQNPFSSWSILELERGLGLRYQVIADIEELLREPIAEFGDEYAKNLQETRDRASLTAKQIEKELQKRTK
jgi:hypothetical protein